MGLLLLSSCVLGLSQVPESPLEGCGSWSLLQSGNSWLAPHPNSLPRIILFPTRGIITPTGRSGGDRHLLHRERRGFYLSYRCCRPSDTVSHLPCLIIWSINSKWRVSKPSSRLGSLYTSFHPLSGPVVLVSCPYSISFLSSHIFIAAVGKTASHWYRKCTAFYAYLL